MLAEALDGARYVKDIEDMCVVFAWHGGRGGHNNMSLIDI